MLAFDTSFLPLDPADEPILHGRREEPPPAVEPALDRRHQALPSANEPALDRRHQALPPVDVLAPRRARAALPPVDEPLLAPDAPYEVLDGVLVPVSAAHAPHANRHNKVSALLESHVGAEFQVAADMLTRTSETNGFAPDVSVYPQGPDPDTGGRQLEQLAFEICASESLSHAAGKAAKLTERGVRRVFAIDVKRQRVLEWSRAQTRWQLLDPDSAIEDPALAAPLRVGALLEVVKIDNEMARALLIKGNEVFEATTVQREASAREAGFVQGKAEGEAKGKADGIIRFLVARGVSPDATARERILAEQDFSRLDRWIVRAASCGSIAELLAEP
jgi:Uma2 family endonuclease